MNMHADLVLRRVRPFGGIECDIAIIDGKIASMGQASTARGPELDGCGHILLPGLHDHHIHLLATAAARQSISLAGVSTVDSVAARLIDAARAGPPGSWLRAVDYDERAAGLLTATDIDRWLPDNPARILDRTGALWMLNSLALAQLGTDPFPDGVECDADGQPNGRIWRSDRWLGERLRVSAPDLAELSRELARFGVTGVTDTGVRNGVSEAALFSEARASGALAQKLVLMGDESLPEGQGYRSGALKILLDERDLPDLDALIGRIGAAHAVSRPVAIHCVTATELGFTLAAFETAGAVSGDRIEHANIVPREAVPVIKRLGLTLCVQPGFIATRGDRYLTALETRDRADFIPLRRLADAGIPLAGGSDAPYGPLDPWQAMVAATTRLTPSGQALGLGEALAPREALDLFLGSSLSPATPMRAIAVGQSADLCLLAESSLEAWSRSGLRQVRATLIDGAIAWLAD